MKGINRIELNPDTMKAIVQAYLDSTLLKKSNLEVTSVEQILQTFVVTVRGKDEQGD